MNQDTRVRCQGKISEGSLARSAKELALSNAIAPDREMEALLRSTLDALSAHIAVLDETGTIISVNEAWRAFARATGFIGDNHGVGMNYLAVCERGSHASEDAARTADALHAIIAGLRSEFRMENPCNSPDGLRWFQLRVTRPQQASTPRIVVAHEDITEVKRAQGALARLSERLIQIQDEERRTIARELHDTTAQNLLAITLNMTRLHEPLGGAGELTRRVLAETLGLAEQCLQEVRTLSYLLHPPLLDEMGLGSALQWFARGFSERSGIDVEVSIAEDSGNRLGREIATTLFRVAQEALSNVHRHSGSAWAKVALHRTEHELCLEVFDRGRGLRLPLDVSEGAQTLGVGVAGMRVRLEQLGGHLEIRSGQSGTCVTATVPVASRRADETIADASTKLATNASWPT